MMKILNESFQDTETYLLSQEVLDKLYELDFETMDSEEVAQNVVDLVADEFPGDEPPSVERVVVLKVRGDEMEIVTADHYAVRHSGSFYDYSAILLTEEFNNLIGTENLPVVQNVITNDAQINDKVSTIKGYAMLSYK